jgi:hypothetical protein
LGAAAGVAVSWKWLKTKYERIAQEEIDSVIEVFSRRNGRSADESNEDENKVAIEKTVKEPDEKLGMREYAAMLAEKGYTKYSDAEQEKKEAKPVKVEKPYTISPEEFRDSDYEAVSLTYYADGTLTDDMDNIIEDVESMVGLDSLDHFGEYEDDSVFVRNDEAQCDYEILRDSRNYADVKKPYRAEE